MTAAGAEHHWQWIPGGFEPASTLPLSDRGFRYGMAVFETLRVRSHETHFVGEHLERLAAACHESGFPVANRFFEDAERFLLHAAWPHACGVARVHVTAGDGTPGEPARGCRFFVTFEAREPPPPELLARGYRLTVSQVSFSPVFGGRKTHNYWPNIEAFRQARLAGFDEALLFDSRDRLVSACLGNVLVCFKGRSDEWVTPHVDCGARRGVVREWAIKQLGAVEAVLDRSALVDAHGIFVTNSWIGIMQSMSLGDKAFNMQTLSLTESESRQCLQGIFWQCRV